MPSFSKFLVASLATQASGLVLSPARPVVSGAPRAGGVAMQAPGGMRKASGRDVPKQDFDNGMSGWKPPSGSGAAHTLGGEYSATDTPDFLPDEGSDQAKMRDGIAYTDGILGSQVDPNRKKNSGPELQGVLDSDPDIYVPEVEDVNVDTSLFVLPEPEWRIDKMEVSATHADFEITCDSTGDADLVIEVKPVCMTFENYFCGFTPDSHPAFKLVGETAGTMERRNGAPTPVQIMCDPCGASGELVAHLCFILPDEKDFSTYYKITCTSR